MRKFFHDVALLVTSELQLHVRDPVWVLVGIFEPLVYLLLFAPFLKGVASAPGFPAENVTQFFAPGLLIMPTLWATSFVGFGLLDKLESGVLERLRVTPISRLSLALGYLLENTLVLLFQSMILLLCGAFIGLQIHFFGTLVLFCLLFLIGIVMSSASCGLALKLKETGVLASVVNFVIVPLYILSGIMLPVKFAPTVIQTIAAFNPFYYAVSASRYLIAGNLFDTSVIIAFALFGTLAVIGLSWFIRVMKETVS